ncbi:hypothetical protein [Bradyrhizobium canariense]|nr:hypothetical protein [Bradyrhizobium canariense]
MIRLFAVGEGIDRRGEIVRSISWWQHDGKSVMTKEIAEMFALENFAR